MFDFNGDGKVDSQEMAQGMFVFDQISKDNKGSGGGGGGNNGGGSGCLTAIVVLLLFLLIINSCGN